MARPTYGAFLHLIFRAEERRDYELCNLLIDLAHSCNLLNFDEWVEIGYLDIARGAPEGD